MYPECGGPLNCWPEFNKKDNLIKWILNVEKFIKLKIRVGYHSRVSFKESP